MTTLVWAAPCCFLTDFFVASLWKSMLQHFSNVTVWFEALIFAGYDRRTHPSSSALTSCSKTLQHVLNFNQALSPWWHQLKSHKHMHNFRIWFIYVCIYVFGIDIYTHSWHPSTKCFCLRENAPVLSSRSFQLNKHLSKSNTTSLKLSLRSATVL